MKKYREYMDGVQASDTLHQRLLGLEASSKRPVPWARYGTVAAALVLVCGLGAWGLSQGGWEAIQANFKSLATYCVEPEIADAAQPDIALVEPGEMDEQGEKSIGGYDVTSGSGENAMVTHYVLPYIEYGDASSQAAALDWDIPKGAIRRDLPQDEIIALMGGEDAVNTHLDWGGYELSGWAAWNEDGSFWGAYINGEKIPAGLPQSASYPCPDDRFEFAVTADQLPPTCVVYSASVTQEVRGLTITADKYDWELGGESLWNIPERRVNFFKDNCGYRFAVSSADTEQAELLVSRLVRQIADKGLGLEPTEQFAEMRSSICDICGEEIVAGTKHLHKPYDPEICGLPLAPEDDGDSTEPYDPNEAVDMGSIAPVSVQPEPPTLRVRCSEGLVDGRSSNYEWTYTDYSSGEGVTAGVNACGSHPLVYRDAPSLTTADGAVILNFFDLPDRVTVNCWPDSAWDDTSAASQTSKVTRGEQAYSMELKEGGWIYEISAQWDDQGTASYVFYLIKN